MLLKNIFLFLGTFQNRKFYGRGVLAKLEILGFQNTFLFK